MVPMLRLLAGVLAIVVLVPASSALAAPGDDYQAVFRDWRPDMQVTPCRFSKAQLVSARGVAGTLEDFDSYAPGFREEVGREVARHNAGGCKGISPGSTRRKSSALRNLRIVAIAPRGGALESVTIRNTGRRAVSLGGATLRDRAGNRVDLGPARRLGGRRALRVFSGCARGRRKPSRLGARLFACRRGRLWEDSGDVVKIADSRGTVVAQRGYGRLRSIVRF